MAFRLFSDIHNEFSNFELPALPTDAEDVLILAGDIGVMHYPRTFAPVVSWAKHFRQVIHVPGNHEYYHGSLMRVRSKLRDYYDEAGAHNVIVANDDIVRVDDVSFVCGTLWTDCRRGDPMVRWTVQTGMNDFKIIRTGLPGDPYKRRMDTDDTMNMFAKTKAFIFDAVVKEKASGQKVVVVTHHGPTMLSVHPMYGNDLLNWGYVSDLSNEILDTQPNIWVHGHSHHTFNYMMGDTNVITNPRGYAYPGAAPENPEFNPELRIEV